MPKNPQTTSQLHSSHMRKEVVLKIQQVRLQQYVNCGLPVVQSGFRKGIRTRVQIDIICWIIEKAKAFQKKKKKNFYLCFINHTKSFDCVDHNEPWEILQEMGKPEHLSCLLINLYAGQEAIVRTEHGTTDWLNRDRSMSVLFTVTLLI